jgi:subtilisin family serine protease
MIITSGLIPKVLYLLSILISATAVIHDDAEQHRYNDDATTTKKTYIVTLEDDVVDPAERCADLAMSNGGFVNHVYDQVFKGCALTFPATHAQNQAAFTALGIDSSVMDVEEDQRVYTFELPVNNKALALPNHLTKDASSSKPLKTTVAGTVSSWGLDRINQCAPPLDGIATKQDATGVKVFIIDTGVRGDHVEFADGVISDDDCHFSAIDGETALTDRNGHG